ncbi:MAG: bifunctional glutamate N-acetyltransferase/amino-acid acetyltransferase ArgJ [Planctomycetaceae bacterium]|jgi:glutamate N-acetyltransferase/amino-acid N-acetyltransferase|nr:bifunctional glutamate N-acetyltransferase/amino-acid acetyltransferase ArgJ [Planctomycetaceae bacterium]
MQEIILPKGYRFSGVHCGLKSAPELLDISLIVSDRPAAAAGVFTPNLVCGAPVQIDRSRVPCTGIRAVVGNSRCANACTGEQGLRDAEEMAALAAKAAGGTAEQGLVMSTGVIGTMLPMDKIRKGIADAAGKLAADESGFINAAQGIMTTDTVEKFVTKKISACAAHPEFRIAGLCKGAAMIAPHLATMLAVIITDAALEPQTAQTLLKNAADISFNCITIDGHTSTSDTLLLLANGAASETPLTGEPLRQFEKTLQELCTELAVKIPADGEGASHLITIDIAGCAAKEDAKIIARKIAEDALVKTAIYGADPNWGRIVSASGTAGIPYDPRKVSLKLNGFDLFKNGEPLPFDKVAVSSSIRDSRNTFILLTIGEGTESVRFWTTDLTAEYVRLNSDYTT